jgi:hypothetical protein
VNERLPALLQRIPYDKTKRSPLSSAWPASRQPKAAKRPFNDLHTIAELVGHIGA